MASISKAYEKYAEIVQFSGMRIDPVILLIITAALAIAGAIIGSFVDIALAILLPIVAIDLGIGLPFLLARRKVDKIEETLPDILHHMSTTLKTGGTIETALEEVSRMDYGPITVGIRRMLKEMREGSTFERSFNQFAERSRSDLLKRASMIIIAARKSGGGLVDTLTAMSNDIRSIRRLKSERRTKTMLQFLFIITTGCFIAPFVFGIVRSVLSILVGIGEVTAESAALVARFDIVFKVYLVIESALSVLGAVQVREGKMSKAVLYIPILALVTYIIYVIVASQFLNIIGGAAPIFLVL